MSMNGAFKISTTILVKNDGTRQLHLESEEYCGWVNVELRNRTGEIVTARLYIRPDALGEIYVPEFPEPICWQVRIITEERIAYEMSLAVKPARHWFVHIVQLSHHDLGYTSLPSIVRQEHCRFLEQAVDFYIDSQEYPEDAKFRAVIEQFWSLESFLEKTSPIYRHKMLQMLRAGRMEVTALYGNMISEVMGHAEMLKCLQPAADLAKKHRFKLTSAEHNDIPGFSSGLAAALAASEIPMLVLGLPTYHSWANNGCLPLWDDRTYFRPDLPFAASYIAPGGKEIFLWCNNRGCGGDMRANMPGLTDALMTYEQNGYVHDVIRWPVQGAARDNSPFIFDYCDTVKTWNENWIWPRLIISTNALFYLDFIKCLKKSLPILHGEMPGQDYPAGTLSTTQATMINRQNQLFLPDTSKLAAIARIYADYIVPQEQLNTAWQDLLTYDEHAWGFHFPAGPAATAARIAKELPANRCAALSHDISCRAFAAILHNLPKIDMGCWLAVFNPGNYRKSALVHTPMREFDNIMSNINAVPPEQDPSHQGYLAGMLLFDRWHDWPPDDFLNGSFRLIDNDDQEVPFALVNQADLLFDAFSAQRQGLGQSRSRIDYHPNATGLLLELCFLASDLPANSIKLYRIIPDNLPKVPLELKECHKAVIENEFYRITVQDGNVQIYCTKSCRDLIDPNETASAFRLLVTSPQTKDSLLISKVTGLRQMSSPIISVVQILGSAPGHPEIAINLILYKKLDQIDLAMRIVKDDTPLLQGQINVPFNLKKPRLMYDGVLAALEPPFDWIVSMRAGAIPINEWAVLNEASLAIIMRPPTTLIGYDIPTPANVSFAHRSVCQTKRVWPFKESIQSGKIYWHLFDNNFGTNFSVSQCGCLHFSASFRTVNNSLSESEVACLAGNLRHNCLTHFRQGHHYSQSPFPFGHSLLELPPAIQLLLFEPLLSANRYRLQIWNRSENSQKFTLRLHAREIQKARKTLANGMKPVSLPVKNGEVHLTVIPHGLLTLTIEIL